MDEKPQHPAYAFIHEAKERNTAIIHAPVNSNDLAQRYRGSIYSAVSSGQDIKTAYTTQDHLKIWWASKLEQLSGLPGKFGKYKGAGQSTQNHVECRILTDRIKSYRAEFGGRLQQATEMQAYCRNKLGEYSTQRAGHGQAAIEDRSKAMDLEDLVTELNSSIHGMRLHIPEVKDHTSRVICGKLINEYKTDLDEAHTALDDFEISMKEHNRTAKVFTVMYSSMEDRYQRVADMCAILRQKGTHLDQVLSEWERGISSSHVILLKQKIDECDFALKRVNELNREYSRLEHDAARFTTMPDSELEAAYSKACQTQQQREVERKQARDQAASETNRVAIG
jgi:hypothetical protein